MGVVASRRILCRTAVGAMPSSILGKCLDHFLAAVFLRKGGRTHAKSFCRRSTSDSSPSSAEAIVFPSIGPHLRRIERLSGRYHLAALSACTALRKSLVQHTASGSTVLVRLSLPPCPAWYGSTHGVRGVVGSHRLGRKSSRL